MKTKISAAVIALFFLMACGSSEPKQEAAQNVEEDVNVKFILKASNMMFIKMDKDSVLIANEPISTNAQVFEIVDLNNGRCALKVAPGKYVVDDRKKENKLFGNSPNTWDWESFEIIALDQTKVNIKASSGMFVCADQTAGSFLKADRAGAGDWETFELLRQN
ncbi:MAG: Fascin domain [Bacteroidetes bacterium]|jgi:hypothetical protein|nr:Fascin domain [Bacteroidota bacterium]